MNSENTVGNAKHTMPSLSNSRDGVWLVVDYPTTSVVDVERGVLSVRGWAWSRAFRSGKVFLTIDGGVGTDRKLIRHRYCRFDISQVIHEIPLANYAGFEISIDRFDLPKLSKVTLELITPDGMYRLNPIQVTVSHDNPVPSHEEIGCDCCQNRNLVEVGRKEGLTLRRCQNCGLVFTSPRPDVSLIHRRYSKDYFRGEYLPEIHSLFEERQKHWNNILDHLERFKSMSPCLFEIGTGAGYLLGEATKRGWAVSGIDVNAEAVAYARSHGLEVIEGDISNIELPGQKFGAIIVESVLEHVQSPRQVLALCSQALYPGGGIFIWTLGNDGDAFLTQGMDFKYVGPSEHLYYFSTSALCRLCELVDLRVESVWRDSTSDSLALVATRRFDCLE